jgi:signal transduction histidine kinase
MKEAPRHSMALGHVRVTPSSGRTSGYAVGLLSLCLALAASAGVSAQTTGAASQGVVGAYVLAFLENHPSYVAAGLIALALGLLLVVGFLVLGSRRRRAQEDVPHRSVTDPPRTGEEIEQLATRNGAMLRAIPDLMFVVRHDGTYVDYHAKDPALLFVAPDVFMGRTIRDVMPPDLGDRFMEALERACRSDEPVVVEYDLPLSELRHFEARMVGAGHDRVLTIVRDVTAWKRAIELNRDLAGRLIASQETERQRIARELHDDVSQKIALLNIDIDQVAGLHEADAVRPDLERFSRSLGVIAADIHDLSYELHPAKLQTLGLVSAIQSLCRDLEQRLSATVEFEHRLVPQVVNPDVSLCLYRVTQEALHNVARHSRAREVFVSLAFEDDQAVLKIADSGIGFDPLTAEHVGLGLASMRERVTLLEGQLTLHASRGRGTRIAVRVPLRQQARSSPTSIVVKSA